LPTLGASKPYWGYRYVTRTHFSTTARKMLSTTLRPPSWLIIEQSEA